MKLLKFVLMISVLVFSFVSCTGEEDENEGSIQGGTACTSTFDCPVGYVCDTEKKICTSESGSGGNTDNPGEGGNGNGEGENNPGNNDGDDDPITGDCKPGKEQKCPFQGPPSKENVGECKAGTSTCQDNGKWGKCVGEVLPVYETGELCNDGLDNDCNGVVDDGTDFDGDGVGACTDCCETTEQCPFPEQAWDASISTHLCEYEVIETDCESGISESSTNPFDYAKAIGICKTTTEDSNEWGLISAEILTPTGNSSNVHDKSNALLSALGNVIRPKEGGLMLGLSSGQVNNPFSKSDSYYGKGLSGAPADWVAANGGSFPAAASCESSGTSGGVNDAVMLQMRIRVPKTARSFSFNIYFLTKEYPKFICTRFNDFFIALLDSTYTSSDQTLQNPKDKNLAMDSLGNPVGINLAPGGLFTQCVNAENKGVTSCVGTEELQGTGFESNGGTGWLTTRGNVVGGEVITLRLAIWDLSDQQYDSLVLIDNFKWDAAEYTPGTGNY